MTPLEAAKEFYEKATDWTWDDTRAALKELTEDVQKAFWAYRKSTYFEPEKADLTRRNEHLSPSGRYKLVTTPFKTGTNTWSYTQGLVYKVGSDTPIAEVQRNYSSFPFLFVEDHPNGHQYLTCGEDYQGQTVIELDTGERRNYLPAEAKQGHGFCWSSYRFHPESLILVVDGCYWASSYDFKFFDFSDPMSGWPEIETETDKKVWVQSDDRWPTFNQDGTITCYQSEDPDDEWETDEEYEAAKAKCGLASTKTFRREGLKLILQEEWVSDKERADRAAREEGWRKYQEWLDNFRSTDPLYLTMLEQVKDPAFKPQDYDTTGQTHDTWCPDFKGKEKRMCRRIHRDGKHTFDLEWAVDTGPVKLQVFREGKHLEDKFFMAHSTDSILQAFTYAKALLENP